jgi:hypothetical protein
MADAHGKQIYHEGGMIDGSFGMVKLYENDSGLVLTLKDQVSGHTGELHFDKQDETNLAVQLKEEAKSKAFCKALVKKVSVNRQPTEIKLILKDLIIETQEEKQAKREREEAERKAREEAERLAKEEAERKAKEEEERKKREEEERLERERIAREEAEKDAAYLASLSEEERAKVLADRAGLGTSIIDSVEEKGVKEYFKDDHIQMDRPKVYYAGRKKKTQRANTFAELEAEERVREEEARKPKDYEVDQAWDDPLGLLTEYREQQKQHNAQDAIIHQLMARKAKE